MAYAKKASKIKWKIVIPLIVLLAAILYLIISILFFSPEEKQGVEICNYSANKTENILLKESEDIYQFSDYFYYGENLNLLKDKYDLEKKDDLIGKTIKVRNLCTNEEMIFQLDAIDHQIDLSDLKEGFYEVYVVNNLEDYRLTSLEEISDTFYTAVRNNKVNKVDLIATNNFLNLEEPLLNNYVYLNVTQTAPQANTFDILIDPAGGNDDYGTGVDLGYQGNGLLENDEMYDAAVLLKQKLEEYGLSVGITKQQKNELIDTNGFEGRVYHGYNHQAKYYFNLQFNSSSYSTAISGIEVTHSHYASSTIANQIIHDMANNVGLAGNAYMNAMQVEGVVMPSLSKGTDGRVVYDSVLQIRESGGMATGAAMITDSARGLNGGFALNNRYGMQANVIKFVYISNKEDAQLWKDQKDAIIQSLADSIANYMQVEKQK